MERNIKNLGTAENILVLCSRFWLKAHVFKCNTPLILIDHTFKAAKIDSPAMTLSPTLHFSTASNGIYISTLEPNLISPNLSP